MPEKFNTLLREYHDGKISRRDFMRRAATFTGGLALAESFLAQIVETDVYAGEVDENDPAISAKPVEYPGKAGTMSAYLAQPSAAGKYPVIIVIHANQGLNDYTCDVARRLAKQNYAALAVDFLSRHGGTKKVNPKGEGLSSIRELAPWQAVAEDADAGYAYLRKLPQARADRAGVVGFCWGGEMTFSTATEVRGLNAVVVFYGRSPKPLERVKNIQAPVLAHYGEKDPGVNQDIPSTEEAMKQYNKFYTYTIYPGAPHGFHTETSDRYHPQAAKEAWAKTLAFFKTNLQS